MTVRRRGSAAWSGLVNGLLTLVLVAAAVFLVWWTLGKFRKEQESAKLPRVSTTRRAPGGSGGGSMDSDPARPSVEQHFCEASLYVVAQEIARLRGRSAEAAKMEAAAHLARAEILRDPRADQGLLNGGLEPGDRIHSADDFDLGKIAPAEAADHLTRAFRKVPAGAVHKFRIVRRGEERDVYLRFPVAAILADARFELPERIRISNELAQKIQARFWSLAAYYRDAYYTPEERETVTRVLGRSEATAEEFLFLSRRVLAESNPEVDQEQHWFRVRLKALDAEMASFPVKDFVTTRDGRQVAGRIVDERDDLVKVQTEYGRVTIYRSDLQEIETAASVRQAFGTRLKAAASDPSLYPELLRWTETWSLPAHREYLAYLMLVRNPGDETARAAAGYGRGPAGRWELPVGGVRAAARAPETRAVLQTRLEELGFVLKSDRWFSKVPWSAGIDTLYKDAGLRWTAEGVSVMTTREGESPMSVFQGIQVERGQKEMFLAPVGTAGSVTLAITAPSEIWELKVKARASVIDRNRLGTVEAVLTPEGGGAPRRLYLINQMSSDQFYDVTENLRGLRRFTVTAKLTTTQDRFHTYARFLPCVPASKETFWVKGLVLVSAPDIDQTWAAAPR